MNQILKIGTLNVRGCNNTQKVETIIQDCKKYNLDIVGITETHTPRNEELTYVKDYTVYTVNKDNNKHHGVGIAAKTALNPTFKKLSNRICKATIKLHNRRLHLISIYAPTNSYCEKHPEEREEIYNILQTEYVNIPNRDYLILCGDFNAKVGTKWYDYPDNLGRYGKGTRNNSGEILLDFCAEHDLIITNTLFKHKPTHITTWTAPYRKFEQNNEPRKNPIRNQIDYIITKVRHKRFIRNSRAYGGIDTDTDHKLVITHFTINWYKTKRSTTKTMKIDYSKLDDPKLKEQYQKQITSKMEEIKEDENQQEKWNKTCEILKNTAEKVLGKKKKKNKRKLTTKKLQHYQKKDRELENK